MTLPNRIKIQEKNEERDEHSPTMVQQFQDYGTSATKQEEQIMEKKFSNFENILTTYIKECHIKLNMRTLETSFLETCDRKDRSKKMGEKIEDLREKLQKMAQTVFEYAITRIKEIKEEYEDSKGDHRDLEECCNDGEKVISKTESRIKWILEDFQTLRKAIILNTEEETTDDLKEVPKVLSKRKKRSTSKRPKFDEQQTGILNKWYENNLNDPYPDVNEKKKLVVQTGLTYDQVQFPIKKLSNVTSKSVIKVANWFINKRMRSEKHRKL